MSRDRKILCAAVLLTVAFFNLQNPKLQNSSVHSKLLMPDYAWVNVTGTRPNATPMNLTLVDSQRPVINPYPYQIIISPPIDYCTNRFKPTPFILAAVISAPSNFKIRQMIRATWGSQTHYAQTGIVPLFFLGQPPKYNDKTQETIIKEYDQYGDIVQADFVDCYKNLTLKSILVVKWTSLYCTNVPFVLKIDDDVILNSYRLTRYLLNYTQNYPNTPQILCRSFKLSDAAVSREPANKWSVQLSEYPNYNRQYHPEFCSGIAYILTSNLAAPFYNASLFTPFLFLEDVFLTGLVPETINTSYIRNIPEAYIIQNIHEEYGLLQQLLYGRTVFSDRPSVIFGHEQKVRKLDKYYNTWKWVLQEET